MSEEEDECRDTDQQVDERLNRRPRAEEEIYNIPIAAHVRSECDETPIESADYGKSERDSM